MKFFLAFFFVTILIPASSYRWKCAVVRQGRHYARPLSLGLSCRKALAYNIRFENTYTPYSLGPDCQLDWNKLWGRSRCGFLRHHQKDSDRFVWRAHPTVDGAIQLAAYSYDNGDKPYQNQPRLLQVFETILWPDQVLGSMLESALTNTIFTLFNGTDELEQITIQHENHCRRYNRGYRLGLYFGGNCEAPSDVSVCYQKTDELF
jgi:hypothetical protein